MNNLPKSLHTVSVLVNVARELGPMNDHTVAVAQALKVLGYPVGTPDTYGLAAKAVAQLAKSVQS